jgi:outer membrane protein OmpA-like peptidoglycan-associated protein/tetratricopeptide (TPR) repeat protein
MKARITLITIIFLGFSQIFYPQNLSEKETFEDGEYFFISEDYTEALSSYLRLYKRGFKNNANLNYRIGICYLESNTEKDKSIEFLEKAVTKVSDKYEEGSIKETNAPYDAYLFLGNAYRINMQLDKAITAYGKFITLSSVEKKSEKDVNANKTWAQSQIEACKRAKTAITKPVRIKVTSMGKPLNTTLANYNPIISSDERCIVFITHQKLYDAIMFSTFAKNKWSNPDNITPDIQSDGDQFPCFISNDKKTLLLAKQDNFNSDIYISHFDGKIWSQSLPLNKEINSKYWESHACLSPDGKVLFFTSNRPQSIGGTDIFVSELKKPDEWGTPVNIGNTINTTFNEETPFISDDGKTLYFSSQGHENIGGYDIFFSTKDENGNWSKPVNLGYPINTPGDDLFYVPVHDKFIAYQAKYLKDGVGDLDLTKIEIFSKDHPYIYGIQGNLSELLKNCKPEDYKIILSDAQSKLNLDTVSPSKDGIFTFNKESGTYCIDFQSAGFSVKSKSFTVPVDYPSDVYLLSPDITGISDTYQAFLDSKQKPALPVEKSSELKTDKNETRPVSNKPAKIKNILFSFDDFNLTGDAENEISQIVKIMQENPSLVLEIIGYTDSQGKDRYNKRLSENRAKIVKDKLTDAGIKAKRIKTRGEGKEKPIAINENADGTDNPEGRTFNRRVEFKIVECDNKSITVDTIKVPEKLKIKK